MTTNDPRSTTPAKSHQKRFDSRVGVVGLWLAFAALGWVIGHDSRGSGPQRTATSANVSFVVPKHYVLSTEQPEAVLEALGIGEPLSYGPTENIDEGVVVVGQGHGQGPELLSNRASANLRVHTGPLFERLGQEHVGVRSSGRVRIVEQGRRVARAVTVFSIPTAGAIVYVVCLPPPKPSAVTVLEACERLATTIKLPAGFGTPLTVGEINGDTHALEAILRAYADERVRLRAALARARSAAAQQMLVRDLSTVCARSGRSLSGLPYNPLIAPLQTRMLAAIARCRRAYNLLSRAIASNDEPLYASAEEMIRAADKSLSTSLVPPSATL